MTDGRWRTHRALVGRRRQCSARSAFAVLSAGFAAVIYLAAPTQAGCVWRGTAPACDGSCSPGEQELQRKGGINAPFGDPGEPSFGNTCFTGSKALCCALCPSGLVWREATSKYDTVCVTPDERYRLPNGTCASGYIWRESTPTDHVCVTPAEHDAALREKAMRSAIKKRIHDIQDENGTVDYGGMAHPPQGGGAPPATSGPVVHFSDLAVAKDDADVYDSPVAPRKVIGMFKADHKAKIVARHPDGWCKLLGVAKNGGDGWVAYDHIVSHCPGPKG